MDRARTSQPLPAFIYPWGAASEDEEECPATVPDPRRTFDGLALPPNLSWRDGVVRITPAASEEDDRDCSAEPLTDPGALHAELKSAMWRCLLDDDNAAALDMASAALDLDPSDAEARLIARSFAWVRQGSPALR
jgi:hypothetical protein